MRVNCRLSLQTSSALAHFILLSFSRSPLPLLKVPRCYVPLVSLLLLQPSLVITSPIFFIHFHPLIFGFSFFFSFCLLNSTLFLSLSPQHHLLNLTHLFNLSKRSIHIHLWSSIDIGLFFFLSILYLTSQLSFIYLQLRARRSLIFSKVVPMITRRALPLYKVYGNSAVLVLNGTSLKSINALLALSRHVPSFMFNHLTISSSESNFIPYRLLLFQLPSF